jgi:hypothetical protein
MELLAGAGHLAVTFHPGSDKLREDFIHWGLATMFAALGLIYILLPAVGAAIAWHIARRWIRLDQGKPLARAAAFLAVNAAGLVLVIATGMQRDHPRSKYFEVIAIDVPDLVSYAEEGYGVDVSKSPPFEVALAASAFLSLLLMRSRS